MDNLQSYISEYTTQLHKGSIQKVYQGIMTFMSGLKTHLEKTYPNYITGGLYLSYMDMTYFPFTPGELKVK